METLQQCVTNLKFYSCLCWATLVTAICTIIGTNTLGFHVLINLMVVDYLSGVLVGVRRKSKKTKNGGLSSTIAFNGILKKVLTLFNIFVVVQVSPLVASLISPNTLIEVIVWFYVGHEAISIFENGGLLGVKYPKKVRKAFDTLICEEEEKKEGKR